jgi:hypothetical protein
MLATEHVIQPQQCTVASLTDEVLFIAMDPLRVIVLHHSVSTFALLHNLIARRRSTLLTVNQAPSLYSGLYGMEEEPGSMFRKIKMLARGS